MAERYRIEVSKDSQVFSAGHFITYAGDLCERLHGHNYRFVIEVDGALDANAYVVDFLFIRDQAAAIAQMLDHRMLLPSTNAHIMVSPDGEGVDVRFREKHWRFPLEDCVLLPIPNTTTELLARWIGQEMLARLRAAKLPTPRRLAVRLDENFGQWAAWEWTEE